MLFLGTEKYPDEDEYETFLNRYGGYSNAYTDMEDTNYYCSITTEAAECFPSDDGAVRTTQALAGALDRLAQFFIAPTFDRDAVDREVRAIDSEYRSTLFHANKKRPCVWRRMHPAHLLFRRKDVGRMAQLFVAQVRRPSRPSLCQFWMW